MRGKGKVALSRFLVTIAKAVNEQCTRTGGRPVSVRDRSVQKQERRLVLRDLGAALLGVLFRTRFGWPPGLSAAELGAMVVQPNPRRPRPKTLSPELFQGKVAQAYRIAQVAPELLQRMPCYCGCFRSHRHQNNLDCYVDRHAFG